MLLLPALACVLYALRHADLRRFNLLSFDALYVLAALVLARGALVLLWQRVMSPRPRSRLAEQRARARADASRSAAKSVEPSGPAIRCVCPQSGAVLGDVASYTPDEVTRVVERARTAQREWAQTTFDERNEVLRAFMHYVVAHQSEICRATVKETGKTVMEATYGEILTTCEKIRWILRNGEDALADEYRSPPALLFLKRGRVSYTPQGVVGVIVPWNYPFHNIASATASALYAGNAAVVKVSEFSSWSAAFFESIWRRVLVEHGYNPDVVQVITGYGDTGAALCTSGVDNILFIGSPETGKKVMAAASTKLTPVILELGGKDPFIVFDDADVEAALDCALRGCFINCGQNCFSSERLYVHAAIYDRFVERARERIATMRQGVTDDACVDSGEENHDCGCMTVESQVKIVEDMVADAVAKGARVVAGGRRNPAFKNGLFYEPTCLTDLTPAMRIVDHETFGPVMLIFKFSSEDEVVAAANSTPYGLACTIFSADAARADRVARRVESGMVTINDFGVNYMLQSLPFGGVKISGFGKFNGPEGLRGFSHTRTCVSDRFPGVLTKAPGFVRYPVPASGGAIVREAIKMFYSPSIGAKIGAFVDMMRLIVTAKPGEKKDAELQAKDE